MKRRCVAVIIGLVFAQFVAAQRDEIDRAAAAYQNGDYETAITLYETLVASGAQDGAVFFNLGNVYYQSGDLGHALVNYRRAQNLTPRDADLNVNMALSRARRLDIQGDETGLLESLGVLTTGVLTSIELGWITLALWTLWFGLLSAAVLRAQWRDALRAPLIILGVIALAGIVLLGSRLYVASSTPSAVVIESSVNAMSGPGDAYLELFQLHEAAELRLLDQRADWLRFALPDGRQGWIPRESVEPV